MMKNLTLICLISAIAAGVVFSQKEQETSRKYINRPGKNPNLPFSDAVLVNDTLYLAGRLGLDPKTNKPPEDVQQEIRLLLDGFKGALGEAGMSMDNLVYVQVYCPDLKLYDQFNSIYKTYFSKDFPARAFIGSGPLLFGAHFEMQGIAAK